MATETLEVMCICPPEDVEQLTELEVWARATEAMLAAVFEMSEKQRARLVRPGPMILTEHRDLEIENVTYRTAVFQVAFKIKEPAAA